MTNRVMSKPVKQYRQTALTSIDSYKLSHADSYPENTTKVYSNLTPRSLKHFNVPFEYETSDIVWFGLQVFLSDLQTIWRDTFFTREKHEVLAEFEELVEPFCGPNKLNLSRIEWLHNLGYLPLEIKALPEGMLVPVGTPVLTITNTLPEAYWLPNFLETWISADLWKPSTTATISYVYRKIGEKYAELTGGSRDFIQFQMHDFSSRGMSGIVDAARAGAGHLLSFVGTDNISAVQLIRDCYNGQSTFVGASVPATEHSVMCAGGMKTELETYRRLLKIYPSGVISIVSDTWDFWNVITNIARELKDEILNRELDQFGLAKVVFRPDSGDPEKIICGYKCISQVSIDSMDLDIIDLYRDGYDALEDNGKFYKIQFVVDDSTQEEHVDMLVGDEISEAEAKGAIRCLYEIFGGTINHKGFITLNPRVG